MLAAVDRRAKNAGKALVGLVVCSLVCITGGCYEHPTSAVTIIKRFTETSARGSVPMLQLQQGYGVACKLGRHEGAASYYVSDIGRQGVPKLTVSERRELDKILTFVNAPTLRFVKVFGNLYVFDWVAGDLCSPDAPPAFVLNGACNEYYSPANVDGEDIAAPSCAAPPRPWVPGDRGTGTGGW